MGEGMTPPIIAARGRAGLLLLADTHQAQHDGERRTGERDADEA